MSGEVWLGPNAVLAFSREGYNITTVNPRDLLEVATFGGFRKLATQYWKIGLDEMVRDVSKRRFLASLQEYVPKLEESDLLPGPAGIRAQALSEDGKLVDDFIVHHSGRVLHVHNAPPPPPAPRWRSPR
jgi:L-2-hydroxyglutarate oxidase LhgO